MKKNRLLSLLLLSVFFGLLCGLRFIHLGADPPKEISSSMGYMSDPGGYVHNSRNKIMYGEWENDNWSMMYMTPIPHFITYGVFRVFGIGIAQMNLVPVLFSCLCILCIFWLLKPDYGLCYALLGALLLGVNYIFLIFSQAAVRVMPMLFFTLLGLIFLAGKSRNLRLNLALAGAMAFFAYTAKGTFLFILPPIMLGALLFTVFREKKKWKAGFRVAFFYLLGLAAVFLIWLMVIYLPHKASFLPYARTNSLALTPFDYDGTLISFLWGLLKRFWQRPLFFFLNMPVITVLSSLYLLRFAYLFFTEPRKIRLVTWIAAIWMITNTAWFSVIPYRAARHLYALLIPMILLTVDFCIDWVHSQVITRPRHRPLLYFAFLFFWNIFTISTAIILIGRPPRLLMYSRFYLTCGLALAATVAVYLGMRLWPQKLRWSPSRPLKIGLISVLLCFSLAINLKAFAAWASEARYDRREISRDLGRAFSEMRIGGLISMVMVLENQHEAHAYSTGYINRGTDFLERYRITHTMVTEHAEELYNYRRDFPQVMKGAKLIVRYPLWQTYVDLFDLYPPPAGESGEILILEGETFYGRGGIPRYDPQASQKYARRIEPGRKGVLLDLSCPDLPEGKYRVLFRLKAPRLPQRGLRLGRIDVVEERARRVLARRDVFTQDFSPNAAYRDFELMVNLRGRQLPTFRVYSTGDAEIWFDKVTILKNKALD